MFSIEFVADQCVRNWGPETGLDTLSRFEEAAKQVGAEPGPDGYEAAFVAAISRHCVSVWHPLQGDTLQEFLVNFAAERGITIPPEKVESTLEAGFDAAARSIGQRV